MNNLKKIIKILDFDIEYIDQGLDNKLVLFFAHGLGSSVEQWTSQIEFFKQFCRVIAISFQGHGNSTKSNKKADYSINKYAEVAIALIKKLNIKRVVWIGNSMGGVIGYEVMHINDKLISKLITNGTTPILEFKNYQLKIMKIMDYILIKLLGYSKYIAIAAKNSSSNDIANKEVYKCMEKSSPKAVMESHIYLGNYNYKKIIDKFFEKIVILKCDKDAGINKYIEKCILDNVKIINISMVGHIFNLEKPKEYNKIIYNEIKNI